MKQRRSFLKQVCFSGACLCGFSSIAFSVPGTVETVSTVEPNDTRLKLVQEYFGKLLLNIQQSLPEEEKRKIIKELSQIHYDQLNMNEVLKPYQNNLENFLRFLEKEWNWKITYNRESKTIIADENKSNCVCPMIDLKSGIKPEAICFCSEGFAERMFSKVAGKPVSARVISSIHRGNPTCKYQIQLS
jgi:predicted hydrocarbon binding protein